MIVEGCLVEESRKAKRGEHKLNSLVDFMMNALELSRTMHSRVIPSLGMIRGISSRAASEQDLINGCKHQ
jgi:hypothetical protein